MVQPGLARLAVPAGVAGARVVARIARALEDEVVAGAGVQRRAVRRREVDDAVRRDVPARGPGRGQRVDLGVGGSVTVRRVDEERQRLRGGEFVAGEHDPDRVQVVAGGMVPGGEALRGALAGGAAHDVAAGGRERQVAHQHLVARGGVDVDGHRVCVGAVLRAVVHPEREGRQVVPELPGHRAVHELAVVELRLRDRLRQGRPRRSCCRRARAEPRPAPGSDVTFTLASVSPFASA